MPENIAGIKETLDFLKDELSTEIHLSIMAQYHPEYKACNYSRAFKKDNLRKNTRKSPHYAEKLGFYNGWVQEYWSLSRRGYVHA